MKELIEDFARQVQKGIEIFKANPPKAVKGKYANIVISGLGGSGIGGTIVKDMSASYAYAPVTVSKDYHIPSFVGENTLFIASSYSGDTEETLSSVKEALEKKATLICISSGGQLVELAKEKNIDHLIIPGGSPPRANLGYSLTQLISIFGHAGLLPEQYLKDLEATPAFLEKKSGYIQATAKAIAEKIFNKRVIIYTEASHEGVAIRFRQQLNENSKSLCWHHVVPEMNHNELVGWTENMRDHVVIFLRNKSDYPRNQHRIEINKNLIARYEPEIIEVWSEGDNEVENTFYLIHLVDWISYHLAMLKGVDIMDIQVIDLLKKRLSEID